MEQGKALADKWGAKYIDASAKENQVSPTEYGNRLEVAVCMPVDLLFLLDFSLYL